MLHTFLGIWPVLTVERAWLTMGCFALRLLGRLFGGKGEGNAMAKLSKGQWQ